MAYDRHDLDKLQHWVDMNPHELDNLTSSIDTSDDLIDDLLELNDAIDLVVLEPVEAEHRAYVEQLRASYGSKRTENGTIAEGYGICYGEDYGITTLDDWTINHYTASGSYYSNGASGGCTEASIPEYVITQMDDYSTMDTGAASGALEWRIIHWSDRWDAAYWHLQMPMGWRGTYGVLDRIDKFTSGKQIQEYNYAKYNNVKDLYKKYLGYPNITWEPIAIPSGGDYGAAVGDADAGGAVHNVLRGLQGGDSGDRYHLTEAEHDSLTGGVTTVCDIHTHTGIDGGGTGVGNEYGSTNIPNGTNTVDVVFTDTKITSGYAVTATLRNIVTEPSIYPFIITSKALSGFSATFSDNVDSAYYYLDWQATETQDQGLVAIDSGVSTVNVAFVGPRTNTSYVVNCMLRNSVDAVPSIYAFMVTVKTVNGFSIILSGDTDSANYVLEYSIASV